MSSDQANRVRELFDAALAQPASERVAYLDQACPDAAIRREVGELLAADTKSRGFLEPPTLAPGRAAARQSDPAGRAIGSFDIVRLIGSGGMGTVYEARQRDPRRRVALKLMRCGLTGTNPVRRFKLEANILGRLRHPGIAQIYQAGEHETLGGALPYFAMEFVEGARSITDHACHHGLSIRDRLVLFTNVCDAVVHGHQRGVIHRDLKPGNILVDEAGQPKVIDFGVALTTDADLTLSAEHTSPAAIAGTLRYMSPEQCAGDAAEIDVRSDVYALGVVLFELLTGELPYETSSNSPFDIPRIIREIEPRRPSLVNRSLRGDLETITLKVLEKERPRRYQSVAELAQDIRRYLAGEPIEAKRDRRWYVLRKTLARHKVTVAATAAFVAVTVAAAIGLGVLYHRAAEHAEELRKTTYFNTIALAQNAYNNQNTVSLLRLLDECPPDLRNWEWFYLRELCDGSRMTIDAHEATTGVEFSPDGRMLVSRSSDRTIKLWDAHSGELLLTTTDPDEIPNHALVSPDGALLVWVNRVGKLYLYDLAARDIRQSVSVQEGWVNQIAFSSNGRQIITAGAGGTVKLWAVADGRLLREMVGHTADVGVVDWSPDDRWIATADWDGRVILWDAETGESAREIVGHTNRVQSIKFSPSGTRVVTCSWDNTIRVWDYTTGQVERILRSAEPSSVAFSRDGRRVAVAASLAVRVWNLDSREEESPRLGHLRHVSSVAFSPDGATLATADGEGRIRLWDAAPAQIPPTLHGHTDFVRAVAVFPDGERIASTGRDGTIRIWDARTCRELERWDLGGSWGNGLDVTSDGGRLVWGGAGGDAVRVWDTRSGALVRVLAGNEYWVFDVDLSPDDRLVAAACADGAVRIWELDSGRLAQTIQTESDELYGVAFAPDGRRLACTGHDDAVQVWDWSAPQLLHRLPCEDGSSFLRVAFSPDGRSVAAACKDQTVRLWDARTGAPLHVLRGHKSIAQSVAFSRDSRRLASGGYDHLIHVWDCETGKLLLELQSHTSAVLDLVFSLDGEWLVSASNDHTLRIWRAGEMSSTSASNPASVEQAPRHHRGDAVP